MKYRDPNTGEIKSISVKASDTLPIGSVVEFEGDAIPEGWEEVNSGIITAFLVGEPSYATDPRTVFSNAISEGDGLSLVNGNIVVGKGITKVKCSAHSVIQYDGNAAESYATIKLIKNETIELKCQTYIPAVPAWGYSSISLAAGLIEVQEGDILSIRVEMTRAGRIHNDEYGKTYLTVETVE